MAVHDEQMTSGAGVERYTLSLPKDILNVTPETYSELLDTYAMNVRDAREALGNAEIVSAANTDPETARPLVAEAATLFNYRLERQLVELLVAYEPEIFGADPFAEAEPQA